MSLISALVLCPRACIDLVPSLNSSSAELTDAHWFDAHSFHNKQNTGKLYPENTVMFQEVVSRDVEGWKIGYTLEKQHRSQMLLFSFNRQYILCLSSKHTTISGHSFQAS